jgi:hypothetical protein
VITQRLALTNGSLGAVWSCAWCAAELAGEGIAHREDCRWIAEIRADAFPRCPTPCDDDCEQPCHEVHEVPSHRDHNPETCVATIVTAAQEKAVGAAVAAERRRFAAVLKAIAEHCNDADFEASLNLLRAKP